MNGPSVVILVAAFCVLIAGLFAVIVGTNERDRARHEADRLERELEARLTNPATATTVRIPSMTRHLSLVQSDDDYWAGIMRASEELR